MQMPVMDGDELGRKIRSESSFNKTQLLMMTSLGQHGELKRMEATGFSAYLTKPVRQSDLFDSLAIVMRGQNRKVDQPVVTSNTVRKFRRSNLRILLAEDNIVNQQVALALLRKMNMSADAVANGLEAIKALETIPYDLVLMDCQMPDMDGYEATAKIRDPESRVIKSRHSSYRNDRQCHAGRPG